MKKAVQELTNAELIVAHSWGVCATSIEDPLAEEVERCEEVEVELLRRLEQRYRVLNELRRFQRARRKAKLKGK